MHRRRPAVAVTLLSLVAFTGLSAPSVTRGTWVTLTKGSTPGAVLQVLGSPTYKKGDDSDESSSYVYLLEGYSVTFRKGLLYSIIAHGQQALELPEQFRGVEVGQTASSVLKRLGRPSDGANTLKWLYTDNRSYGLYVNLDDEDSCVESLHLLATGYHVRCCGQGAPVEREQVASAMYLGRLLSSYTHRNLTQGSLRHLA